MQISESHQHSSKIYGKNYKGTINYFLNNTLFTNKQFGFLNTSQSALLLLPDNVHGLKEHFAQSLSET